MTDEIEDPTGVWSGRSSGDPSEDGVDVAADEGHLATDDSTRPDDLPGSDRVEEVERLRRRFEDSTKDLEAQDRMDNFEIQDLD